ncbi:MAG TPA: prepilin-type N-terminal cleavage/methylation domain-containing protein [Verrucomicrobiae bacterium]|jgi:prepilin-type N-terminal cleavage/methylation domain-containing protein
MTNKLRRFLGINGFTLIELLVAIAIIGILAALLLTALSQATQAGYKTECASNLKQWGVAINTYAGDNQNRFPDLSYKDSTGNLTGAHDLAWMPIYFNTTFFPGYLMTNRAGFKGAVRPTTDVLYCPTDLYHRAIDARPPPNYQTNLIGYNYLPGRDAEGGVTYNYDSDGLGAWVTNRAKLGGPHHLAPVMVDRLQYDLKNRSWTKHWKGAAVQIGVHRNSAGVPTGANFLFEDGRVSWQRFAWGKPPLTSTGIGAGCRSPGTGENGAKGDYLEYYNPSDLGPGPW